MVRAYSPLRLASAFAFPVLGALALAAETPSDGEQLAQARATSATYQAHMSGLRARLASTDPEVRMAAIRRLGDIDDPQALTSIVDFIESGEHSPEELTAIAIALGSTGNPAAVPPLRRMSMHRDENVRFATYNALCQLAAATPADHTQRAVDADRSQHLAGLTNLGTLKVAEAAALLIAGLNHDPKAIVRRQCAIGLGKLGDVAHGPALQNALGDADAGVRQRAAEAIAALNYRPAIPYLIMALEANVAGDELNLVLKQMTGQDFGFRSKDNSLLRRAAVDRGFAWWNEHGRSGS